MERIEYQCESISTPWEGVLGCVQTTVQLAHAVAAHAHDGDVIAISGELGAGKTRFVKGLAQGLGIDDSLVSSPTFVIVNEYEPNPKENQPSPDATTPLHLIHIDAYRLNSLDDLESIGWEDLFVPGPANNPPNPREDDRSTGSVIAIEWADRLTGQLGEDRLEITLSHMDHDQRYVRIVGVGSWVPRMAELRSRLPRLSRPQKNHQPVSR